jgi:hypothetical protein
MEEILSLFGRAKPQPTVAERHEQVRSNAAVSSRNRTARIKFLNDKVDQHHDAAVRAKRAGKINEARRLLKQKGMYANQAAQLQVHQSNHDAMGFATESMSAAAEVAQDLRAGADVNRAMMQEMGTEDDIDDLMADIEEVMKDSAEMTASVSKPFELDALFPKLTEDVLADELDALDADIERLDDTETIELQTALETVNVPSPARAPPTAAISPPQQRVTVPVLASFSVAPPRQTPMVVSAPPPSPAAARPARAARMMALLDE